MRPHHALKKMLVTLDSSKTAESVLPYARALLRDSTVPVDLMSVIDIVEMARSVSAAEGLFLDRLAEDEAKRRREYLEEIAKSFTGRLVECHILNGNPETVILEAAAGDKDMLIAMTTHGRSGLNRWLLGSVAEKVLRGTSNPLLLVRAGETEVPENRNELKTIIVPLDGSPLAETVLPRVADLAKKLNLGVVLFRSYNIPYGFYDVGGGFAIDLDRLLAQTEIETFHYLEEKSDWLKKAGVVNVTIASRQGYGADEIISYAGNTPDDLIAMCSHGRSGVRRWSLGSVTETVVRHGHNPVLIFRPLV
jgi:nucleotide-binding universal stress UspA family protein